MTKFVKTLAVGLLAASLLCGCQFQQPTEPSTQPTTEPTVPEVTYPYDFTDESFFYIKNYLNYIPTAPIKGVKADGSFFQLLSHEGFTVMQGGCTDGKYCYFYLADTTFMYEGVAQECGMIFKVDMTTWEIVKQSEPLPLSHGNGMCYNPKLGKILVSYCNDYSNTPDLDESKMIGFVDPETLELVESKLIAIAINSIDYNEKRDLYVVGIKGNPAAFAILDPGFNELAWYPGNNVNLGSQDVGCDDKYIYVGNSGVISQPGMEVVKFYNWDGDYVGMFRVGNVVEQEAVFSHGGKHYITFFTGSGGRLYEIEYDFDLLAE